MQKGSLLVVHGGGPTAVMNASLYGVLRQARRSAEIGSVFGAIGGTGGVLRKQFLELTHVPQTEQDRLLYTPGSVLQSSRDPLAPEDYGEMASILRQQNIRWVLMNGGNGTMDACGKLSSACEKYGIRVIGIPKTMDNDLAATDHAPGYGSAARFLACSVAEVCADVKSLPIHIVVIEALGRNAGWVTAAAVLARDCGAPGPDLIYIPERPFCEEAFLESARQLIRRKGFGVIVAGEGLRHEDGTPLVTPVLQRGRSIYFGDVSAYLAGLITEKLGYKSRSEKPGLLGRASAAWQSSVDRQEAIDAAQKAVQAALAGETGKMVAIRRKESQDYQVEYVLVDIKQVMLVERTLCAEFIDSQGGVTNAFRQWCRPLLGELPPPFADVGRWAQRA